MAASAVLGLSSFTQLQAEETTTVNPTGTVTLYYEIRVAKPEVQPLQKLLQQQTETLKSKGLISFSMKQMTGDSTMVKNYPEHYKGILATAYLEGANEGTLPHFYSLFFRFDSYAKMLDSQVSKWFKESASEHLHAYKPTPNGALKLPIKMDYYEGVFETIIAGDMNNIYKTQDELKKYLKGDIEKSMPSLVTVENHVSIEDSNLTMFESRVSKLLEIAQTTYQPATQKENGEAGSAQNRYYKRAVTTEILRNAFANGKERSYIMHGTWESVWDHENSHLDPRFKMAAAPVGSFVIAGPVEPFYKTLMIVN